MSDDFTRTFLVDDTDPRLVYEPSVAWTQNVTPPAEFTASDVLLPHRNLASTTRSDTTLTFEFEGTSYLVFIAREGYSRSEPSPWTALCTIDDNPAPGGEFSSDTARNGTETNYVLCGETSLTPDLHTLTVQVSYENNSTESDREPFWFDYLLYEPLNDTKVETGIVRVEVNAQQAAITFEGDWDRSVAAETHEKGAEMTYSFRAKSFSFIGLDFYTTNPSYYTLDGGEQTEIHASLQEPIVQLDGLSRDVHTLTVTCDEDSDPNELSGLNLYWALIEPHSGDETMGMLSGSMSELRAGAPGKKNNNTGVIVGSVVGGVAFLVLLAGLIFWFCKRRQRRRRQQRESSSIVQVASPAQIPSPVSYGGYSSASNTPLVGGHQSYTGGFAAPQMGGLSPTMTFNPYQQGAYPNNGLQSMNTGGTRNSMAPIPMV